MSPVPPPASDHDHAHDGNDPVEGRGADGARRPWAPRRPRRLRPSGRLAVSRVRAPDRKGWLGRLFFVAMVVIVFGAILSRGRETTGEPFPIDQLAASLSVEFETAPSIGKTSVLVVSGVMGASNTTPTRFSVIHNAGINSYRAEQWVMVQDGVARVPLATNAMREAGLHTITVFTDMQIGEVEADVRAGDPRPGFIPIVGPTRVVADGNTPVLVTVNPTDLNGNSLDPGSRVELTVRRPNGDVETYAGVVDDMVAGIRVLSTTDVGVVVVVATVDGTPSEPVEFSQVPGPPARLLLSSPAPSTIADGRSVVAVRATNITDAGGNVVSDGTSLTAAVTSPSGNGKVTALTINGEANFLVRSPTRPGRMTISIPSLDETASAPIGGEGDADLGGEPPSATITIDVEPAVEGFEAALDPRTATVRVGPVIGWDGGFVADGAAVELAVDGTAVSSSQVLDGYAEVVVPAGVNVGDLSVLEVEILGVTAEVARE